MFTTEQSEMAKFIAKGYDQSFTEVSFQVSRGSMDWKLARTLTTAILEDYSFGGLSQKYIERMGMATAFIDDNDENVTVKRQNVIAAALYNLVEDIEKLF